LFSLVHLHLKSESAGSAGRASSNERFSWPGRLREGQLENAFFHLRRPATEKGQPGGERRQGGQVFAAIRYSDVTSASFVRAKNPRWSSSLASPPADVDMPGGLFRSSRAWLSLQSPYAYLIVRLNDSDFRQVLQTVTERTGVKVDQLAAQ